MRTADEEWVWEAGEDDGVPCCADCGIELLEAHCDYCDQCQPGYGCPCPACERWQREREASFRARGMEEVRR